MTPNMGAGGNAAIESAAALANSISKLVDPNPSLRNVEEALSDFYAKRHMRANIVSKTANKLTRVEAFATLPDKIMGRYVIPALGDFLSDVTCDVMVGAELLDSLPPPPRSLKATMPWNLESGVGKHESKLVRAIYAMPILFTYYGCTQTMGQSLPKVLPSLKRASEIGELVLGNGTLTSLWTRFFGIKSLDNFIAIYVAAFTPSIGGLDSGSRMQMISFLGDLVPFQAIWMIEGIRRGNFVTAAHLL
jgi:hypothetical protein